MLDKVKKYIDENKKLPSHGSKHKHIQQLGSWICSQRKKYLSKQGIMKHFIVREKWILFTDDYAEYLCSNEQKWEEFINEYHEYFNK